MRKRVLLVDPDRDFTERLTRCLQSHGISVALVTDEHQALARARLGKPAAVVVVDLPSRDALKLCDWLRSRRLFSDVPIVVMTAIVQPDVLEWHRQSETPARLYLPRRTDPDEVARRVVALFEQPADESVAVEVDFDDLEMIEEVSRSARPPRPDAVPAASSHHPHSFGPPAGGMPRMISVTPMARSDRGVASAAAAVPEHNAEIKPRVTESAVIPAVRLPVPAPGRRPSSSQNLAVTPSQGALEIVALRRENRELQSRVTELRARLSEAQAQVAAQSEALAVAQRDHEDSMASVTALTCERVELTAALVAARRERNETEESLNAVIAVSRTRPDEISADRDALRQENTRLETCLEQALEESREGMRRLLQAESEVARMEHAIEHAKREIEGSSGVRESTDRELAEERQRSALLESELHVANDRVRSESEGSEEIRKKTHDLERQILSMRAELESQLVRTEARQIAARDQMRAAAVREAAWSEAAAAAKAEIDDLKGEVEFLLAEVDRLASRPKR